MNNYYSIDLNIYPNYGLPQYVYYAWSNGTKYFLHDVMDYINRVLAIKSCKSAEFIHNSYNVVGLVIMK